MNSMRKILVVAILLSAVLAVYALEESASESSNDSVSNEGESHISEMARKRRHRFGHHLWFGGVHAIGALVAIKFKLVLIFLAFMGTVFYGYKIYSGGSSCHTPIIEHSAPGIPSFEGYSSSFPAIYSSSDPYSAYSADHGTAVGSEIPSPGPYRRTVIEKRSNENSVSGFDFGELAFTVLGVESRECRKRFICEMTVNYNRDSIVGGAYKMISKQLFPKYMSEIKSKGAESMQDCATLFSGCHSPTDIAPVPVDDTNNLQEDEEQRSFRNTGGINIDQVQKYVVTGERTKRV